MKRRTAHNSTYKKLAVQWSNEALCFVSSFVVADSFRLRNRQLLVAANRYKQFMKINFIALLILIFIPAKKIFSQKNALTEKLVIDANCYRNIIIKKHKNAFTKISAGNFNLKIDSLIRICDSIDENIFIAELLKINSFIEDEHTYIIPSFEKKFPLKFQLFDDGLVIIATDSINRNLLLCKVLTIDDNPWQKVDSILHLIIKRDNPAYYKSAMVHYITYPDLLNGLGIVSNLEEIKFKLVSPSGDSIFATIRPAQAEQSIEYLYAAQYSNLEMNKINRNYYYLYDSINRIIYFNYRSCQNDKEQSFKSFDKQLFRKIDELQPNKIIVDLRLNYGGNSRVLMPFIRKIKRHPLNKKNHFYVLIGPNVASSAMLNCIQLKKKTNAIFVGEESGGNINHFGEQKFSQLPNTKATVSYSTKYFNTWGNYSGPFVPDVEITNTYIELLRSYDKTLEYTKQK